MYRNRGNIMFKPETKVIPFFDILNDDYFGDFQPAQNWKLNRSQSAFSSKILKFTRVLQLDLAKGRLKSSLPLTVIEL